MAELSCEGIMAIPELHSSQALREMPSADSLWCKDCSTCAWHACHLSPTRDINAWQAQHEMSTGLWAPEYLLMDLLAKCVPVQRPGSSSSVTARHRYRCSLGNKSVPFMRYLSYTIIFFLTTNLIFKPQ